MEQKKKKLRAFLLISNIVIALMCVASILGYFIMPLAEVRVTAVIDRDFISSLKETGALIGKNGLLPAEITARNGSGVLLDTQWLSAGPESIRTGTVNPGEIIDQINLSDGVDLELITKALMDGLGDDTVDLSARVRVTAFEMLSSIPISDSQAALQVIDRNVDLMTEDVFRQYESAKPVIMRMTASVLKAISGQAVKNSFSAMQGIVNDKLGSDEAEEFTAFSERIGLSDGEVEEKVSELIDELGEGTNTPEDLAGKAVGIYNEIFERASTDPEYGGDVAEKFEYDPDYFYDGILNWLSEAGITNDEGFVDLESAMDQLMFGDFSKLIPDVARDELDIGEQSVDVPGLADNGETLPYSSAASTSGTGGNAIKKEEAKAKLKDRLMSLLTGEKMGGAYKIMHIAMIMSAVMLLVAVLSWLYLLIKILAKLGKPNPGVTLWVPIVFGWSLISFLTFFPRLRLRLVGSLFKSDAAGEAVRTVANHMFLGYSTGGVIAAVCGLTLFIFAFIYSAKRRELNTML
jgi:hypothetical protein